MEQQMGMTEARTKFRSIVDRVQHGGETVVIHRHGSPAVVVVPIEWYESWKKQRQTFFGLMHKAQQQANLDPAEAERIATEAVAAIRLESGSSE